MAVKTITITEEAYRKLVRERRSGESFTDVINRVLGGTSALDLVGILSDVPLDRVRREIDRLRREADRSASRKVRSMAT